MSLYEKAKQLAMDAHNSIHQVRKFSGRPYYTHVHAVAELVSSRTDDEEILAAACLHDVLEDVAIENPDYGENWIKKEFGDRVLSLVIELTNVYTKENYPNLNRKQRKELEHARLSNVSDDAKLIKKADLHHNSSEMNENDPFTTVWRKEKSHLEQVLGGSWE